MDDKTQKELDDLLRAYVDARQKSQQWDKLQDDCRKRIVAILRSERIRRYVGERYQTLVTTTIRNSIAIAEARTLLRPEIFDKLLRETTSVVLRVSEVKKDDAEDEGEDTEAL